MFFCGGPGRIIRVIVEKSRSKSGLNSIFKICFVKKFAKNPKFSTKTIWLRKSIFSVRKMCEKKVAKILKNIEKSGRFFGRVLAKTSGRLGKLTHKQINKWNWTICTPRTAPHLRNVLKSHLKSKTLKNSYIFSLEAKIEGTKMNTVPNFVKTNLWISLLLLILFFFVWVLTHTFTFESSTKHKYKYQIDQILFGPIFIIRFEIFPCGTNTHKNRRRKRERENKKDNEEKRSKLVSTKCLCLVFGWCVFISKYTVMLSILPTHKFHCFR